MIYLTTGSNGAGKTLFTLKWVREDQLSWEKQGKFRPVFYHGFNIDEKTRENFGWQECDPKKWVDLPDKSIVIVDECQTIFPVRKQGSEVPDYVSELAISHRSRGFDFYLITQHPNNIDAFIRGIIGSGWHRHLKRIFGSNFVNCLSFNYAEGNCQKPSAKTSAYAEKKMRMPKEVFSWYKSAELHTAKREIPKVIWFLFIAIAVVIFSLFRFMTNTLNQSKSEDLPSEVLSAQAVSVRSGSPSDIQLISDQYLKQYLPRIEGFPHTAPRYDEITKPVTAPYPAACVLASERQICRCYTQQGTLLDVPDGSCRAIVNRGYFLDFEPNPDKREEQGVSGVKPSDINIRT